MTLQQIARQRLHNQYVSTATFETPAEVVQWLGAVQAQDYLASLRAIGLRMRHATEQAIEQAIAERAIVRTWPMRGTIHFVLAADIRWMLALMTPRILSRNAGRLRKDYDLDEATFTRSRDLFLKILEGGGCLTRGGMYEELERVGIATKGQRGLHILWWLSQAGIICFGPREGKQPTFVLLDEWLPKRRTLSRDESLAELALRYFTSHGPATVHDFAWWSGLTLADSSAALDIVRSSLTSRAVDGQTYWQSPSLPEPTSAAKGMFLLPPFDEFLVGYTDRGASLDAERGPDIGRPTIVRNGRVIGRWRRTINRDSVTVAPEFFEAPTSADTKAFGALAKKYGEFLELPAVVES